MKPILFVAMGGAIGSVLRYLAQVEAGKLLTLTFPIGTFIVNITGCLLIGILYGLAGKYSWFTIEWRLFLVTGICGGYTTFSSFSYESISLLREGNYFYFALYTGLSVCLGLLATVGGLALTR